MNASRGRGRRIRIDRLELDLRGIAPATANAAVRSLGPALARTLSNRGERVAPADRIDAGRIVSPSSPTAQNLADGIAQRIAHAIRREGA